MVVALSVLTNIIHSISDVTAADITPELSHQFKILSRELAAAMVQNLGLSEY
jgi:hypothetical protein